MGKKGISPLPKILLLLYLRTRREVRTKVRDLDLAFVPTPDFPLPPCPFHLISYFRYF